MGVGVGMGEGVCVGVLVAIGAVVGVGEGMAVEVGANRSGSASCVRPGSGVGSGATKGERVGLSVAEGTGVAVGDAVGVGVATGSSGAGELEQPRVDSAATKNTPRRAGLRSRARSFMVRILYRSRLWTPHGQDAVGRADPVTASLQALETAVSPSTSRPVPGGGTALPLAQSKAG